MGTEQGADGLRAKRDLFRLGGYLLASKFAVNNCASVVCPFVLLFLFPFFVPIPQSRTLHRKRARATARSSMLRLLPRVSA